MLNRAQDAAALPVFLSLLEDDAFHTPVISLLGRFNAPEIAPALPDREQIELRKHLTGN